MGRSQEFRHVGRRFRRDLDLRQMPHMRVHNDLGTPDRGRELPRARRFDQRVVLTVQYQRGHIDIAQRRGGGLIERPGLKDIRIAR